MPIIFTDESYVEYTHTSNAQDAGTGELDHLIKCLLCTQEDLSFDLQYPHKNQGTAAHAYNPSTREEEMGNPWGLLASQSSWLTEIQIHWETPLHMGLVSISWAFLGEQWGRSQEPSSLFRLCGTVYLPRKLPATQNWQVLNTWAQKTHRLRFLQISRHKALPINQSINQSTVSLYIHILLLLLTTKYVCCGSNMKYPL